MALFRPASSRFLVGILLAGCRPVAGPAPSGPEADPADSAGTIDTAEASRRATVIEAVLAGGTWAGVAVPVLTSGRRAHTMPSLFAEVDRGLPPGTPTLPVILKEHDPDRLTILSLGNPVAGSGTVGLLDGYDVVDEGVRDGDETYHMDALYARGVAAIEARPAGAPFFWWFMPNEAHDPFDDFAWSGTCAEEVAALKATTTCPIDASASTDAMRQYSDHPEAAACATLARAASACELLTVDHRLDTILTDLEARGLLEHTAVVIGSDHGESLGEAGRWNHYNISEWPVTGQRWHLWAPPAPAQNLVVILLGSWRRDFPMPLLDARFADATRSTVAAGQEDLLPTVLALLGEAPPDDIDGVDVLGPDAAPRVLTSYSRDSAQEQITALSPVGDRHLVCRGGDCVLYNPQVDFDEVFPLAEAADVTLQLAADDVAQQTSGWLR